MIMNYRIMENVATLARTILCVKGESRAYAEGRTGDPDDSRSSQQNDLTFFFLSSVTIFYGSKDSLDLIFHFY